MSKNDKSREYLEAALAAAKKLLPGWQYAVLHRAALPASGGRARANRRQMEAMEKLWIEKKAISSLSNSELKEAAYKLNRLLAAYEREGKDKKSLFARCENVSREMNRRGIEVQGALSTLVFTKGFLYASAEGGMHVHGLNRAASKTFDDGGHTHLFVLPGSGQLVVTHEDGFHEHGINNGKTDTDGQHAHHVQVDGEILETRLDGAHSHGLMVETTGFGGEHAHILRLPDGREIKSLTVKEYVDRYIGPDKVPGAPIYSSRAVVSAFTEARDESVESEESEQEHLYSVDEALDYLAKEGVPPKVPPAAWEVDEVAVDGAYCRLADMDETVLLRNPESVELVPGSVVDVDHQSGDIVGFSKQCVPHTVEDAKALATRYEEIEVATKTVDFAGPQNAPLVFVAASPSALELARKEALVGPDGSCLEAHYLQALKLKKSDIAVGYVVPTRGPATPDKIKMWASYVDKALSRYDRAKVVALGRVAKEALGERVDYSLPHPAGLRRHGDSGEVARKLKSIRRNLDNLIVSRKDSNSSQDKLIQSGPGTTLADSISEPSRSEEFRVAVTKSVAEKQIVYGVILDPYQVDLHDDWIPPAEIEATAHDFLEKSRVIGFQHKSRAEAQIVESWVEVYPSQKDRELALKNMPHRVFRRQFGSDVLHSGAWVAGVRLSDELWELHKAGELDAFSIGGFSFKSQISTDAMPEVEFIDLREVAA